MTSHLNETASEISLVASPFPQVGGGRRLGGALPVERRIAGQRDVPLQPHVERGVEVALGTDVGAGTGLSMLKEGLMAYHMQMLSPEGVRLAGEGVFAAAGSVG